MPTLSLFEVFVLLSAATMTALIAMLRMDRTSPEPDSDVSDHPDPASFLFADGVLQDATQPAAALLPPETEDHYWEDLRDKLIPRFPDFPTEAGRGEPGRLSLRAGDAFGPQEALINWRGDLCWVTLSRDPNAKVNGSDPEGVSLKRMSETAPDPVWEEDQPGEVSWHNDAYAALFRDTHGHPVTIHKPLFSNDAKDTTDRVFVTGKDSQNRDWYNLTAVAKDNVTVFHATNINALVAAEQTQRNFVQTLAKTFAHLSIGLAIFDRSRQLALFNPALVDLTGLSAQFLSARPDMLTFFDQLREKRKMPEPKNYLNWRQEIADLISAASDGQYKETWTLESGQTYHVQGRPHPEGATAFLIEDISAEMTLTRNFRAELEQAQIMIDAVDDAMAIFSPAGVLTFSNTAFHKMWEIDPGTAFADVNLQDCEKIWKEKAHAKPDLKMIDQIVNVVGTQDTLQAEMTLKGRHLLGCKVGPIASGGTLIRFYKAAPVSGDKPLLHNG